jgi:hypothetical protein
MKGVESNLCVSDGHDVTLGIRLSASGMKWYCRVLSEMFCDVEVVSFVGRDNDERFENVGFMQLVYLLYFSTCSHSNCSETRIWGWLACLRLLIHNPALVDTGQLDSWTAGQWALQGNEPGQVKRNRQSLRLRRDCRLR